MSNIKDMDIFGKIQQSEGPLGQYRKDAHGYFMFPKLEGEIGAHMTFRGKEMKEKLEAGKYVGDKVRMA